MRKWIAYPKVQLTTTLGPVAATWTNAGHVAVNVEAHINDDAPALVFRGQEYIGMVHLYAEVDGLEPWSVKPSESVHITRRPQWTDAPRTHADAIVRAMADAVREYVKENPDVLRQAEYADANNDLSRLEREESEAREVLKDVKSRIRIQAARLKAAELTDAEVNAVLGITTAEVHDLLGVNNKSEGNK